MEQLSTNDLKDLLNSIVDQIATVTSRQYYIQQNFRRGVITPELQNALSELEIEFNGLMNQLDNCEEELNRRHIEH